MSLNKKKRWYSNANNQLKAYGFIGDVKYDSPSEETGWVCCKAEIRLDPPFEGALDGRLPDQLRR